MAITELSNSPSTPYSARARNEGTALENPLRFIKLGVSKKGRSPQKVRFVGSDVGVHTAIVDVAASGKHTEAAFDDAIEAEPHTSARNLLADGSTQVQDVSANVEKGRDRDKSADSSNLDQRRMSAPTSMLHPDEPYLNIKTKTEFVKQRRKSDSPKSTPLKYAKLATSPKISPSMKTPPRTVPPPNDTDDDDEMLRSFDMTDTILMKSPPQNASVPLGLPISLERSSTQASDKVKNTNTDWKQNLKTLFEKERHCSVRAAYVRRLDSIFEEPTLIFEPVSRTVERYLSWKGWAKRNQRSAAGDDDGILPCHF
jgi:hypothetical protein